MKLLGIANTKTVKGEKQGILTGILYLAPHRIATKTFNACPYATPGGKKACLYSAGRGAFNSVQQARIKKTLWLIKDPEGFKKQLLKDIDALERKAKRQGMRAAVRLNGTSDLNWLDIIRARPNTVFYDYTKNPSLLVKLPKNYSLTYSVSESIGSEAIAKRWLNKGLNVAIVFKNLPKKWHGYDVIDGDQSDARFLDPKGVVVGLTAKGKAKKDTSGFVKDYKDLEEVGPKALASK